MSLLSSVILPTIEKELIALEPAISQFILEQIKFIGHEVLGWAESKLISAQNDENAD